MVAPFDLFRTDVSGTVWCGECMSLEDAKERAKDMSMSRPGRYFALNQTTGVKHSLNVDTERLAATDQT